MLVHEGNARSVRADRRLAWSLAGIAGAVNAAGFYAVGLYASNMTGNVSAIAEHLGSGNWHIALIPFALVSLFVFGAFASTLLVNAGRRRRLTGIYAYSISAEAVLLAVWGCLDLWDAALGRGPLLVFGLSFLMGLQNATVTQISNARVRTTHVTGMVTDIGIELAILVAIRGGRSSDASGNEEKLWLHSVAVLAFLAGGAAGVLVYRELGGALLLFIATALLLTLAIPAIRASRLERPTASIPLG